MSKKSKIEIKAEAEIERLQNQLHDLAADSVGINESMAIIEGKLVTLNNLLEDDSKG